MNNGDCATAARRAFVEGDFEYCARQLSFALWSSPDDGALLSLARELLSASPDLLALTGPKPVRLVQEWGLHALFLLYSGESTAAFQELLSVASVDPRALCLVWIDRWLQESTEGMDPVITAVLAMRANDQLGTQTEQHRLQWQVIARILRRVAAQHPDHEALLCGAALASRNAGDTDGALAMAFAAWERFPGFSSAIALGAAHRDAGQIDDAVTAYDHALRYAPPGRLEPLLDQGDLLEAAGRYEESLSRYRALLEANPGDVWATSSALYLEHRLTDDPAARISLLEMRIAHPEHPRVRALANRLTPWIGYLPHPWESSVSAVIAYTPQRMSAALAQLSPQEKITRMCVDVSMERPEAPTTQLILRRHLEALGFALRVDVGELPDPDPRIPLAEVTHSLWTFRGHEVLPALPAPDPSAPVLAALAALAPMPYHIGDWARRAHSIAQGLDESTVDVLLRAMAHPPRVQGELSDWLWVQRYQIAAALVLAFIPSAWHGSARREALRSLLLGPVDWTVTAAAVAAVALSSYDAEADECLKWIALRMKGDSGDVSCGVMYPLYALALCHPLTKAATRNGLLGLMHAAEQDLGFFTFAPAACSA